jgi:hypothetical protein
MVDNPYQLDPFTTITNIQFGSGKYLLLFGADVPFHPTPTFGSVQATLPGIEGGTPGFLLLNPAGSPYPKAVIVPVVGPVTLTAKNLSSLDISLAGQDFRGFAAYYQTAMSDFAPSTAVYLPLQGILAKKFTVRMFGDAGTGDNLTIGVGLYDNNIVKAGVQLNGTPVVSSPTAFRDTVIVSGSSLTEDFTVDPVKMTIN